jgi:predicted transcriptional regulator
MKGAKNPARSRMEIYLAVIKVLENGDSLTQKQIARKAGLNSISTNEFFNFLLKCELIREKTLENKAVYFITDKGQKIVMYFG